MNIKQWRISCSGGRRFLPKMRLFKLLIPTTDQSPQCWGISAYLTGHAPKLYQRHDSIIARDRVRTRKVQKPKTFVSSNLGICLAYRPDSGQNYPRLGRTWLLIIPGPPLGGTSSSLESPRSPCSTLGEIEGTALAKLRWSDWCRLGFYFVKILVCYSSRDV